MNARDFANSLMLDLAIEQVGENNELPASYQEGAAHYLCCFLRPGVREAILKFSVPAGVTLPDADAILFFLSYQSLVYVNHPTPVTWSELTQCPLDELMAVWPAFERDQRTLSTFFGEHYQTFLELDHA